MTYKMLPVKKPTKEMVESCKKVFIAHHPEFEHVPISADKIIYEMAKWYLHNEHIEGE